MYGATSPFEGVRAAVRGLWPIAACPLLLRYRSLSVPTLTTPDQFRGGGQDAVECFFGRRHRRGEGPT